jgi:HlyD family secretion protein
MKNLLIILILLGAAGAGGVVLYARYYRNDSAPAFRTAEVTRGDLLVTISATGTVQPEEVVDVGAQVLGRIISIGPDALAVDPQRQGKEIDYTSQVEEGTVLANIDDALYRAQRNAAKAALERAEADLEQLKARRDLAAADFRRARELRDIKRSNLVPTGLTTSDPARPIKAITEADYDQARFNFDMADANVKVGASAIAQQAAALELAETNLNFTVIKSPVKGTIIDRRVNIGQTVVASLNAPSLFLIAKDLSRVEVWAQVNEADIGQLQVGVPVRFKVDAYPKRLFKGKIAQIRLNANMTQNVVTYTVVISTENQDRKLLPYMTAADIKFEVDQRKDVLLVPNAAIRFEPRPEQVLPGSDTQDSHPAGAPEHAQAAAVPADSESEADWAQVWVEKDGLLQPLAVKLGATDGTVTEISGAGIVEGMSVVIGQPRVEAEAAATSPFVPQFRRRRPAAN